MPKGLYEIGHLFWTWVLTPPPYSRFKKLQYCYLGASLSGSVWVSVGQHLVIESKFIGCCKDGGAISTLRNGRPAGEQLNNQVRKGGHRSCPPFTTDIIAPANNSLTCPLTQQAAQNRLPTLGLFWVESAEANITFYTPGKGEQATGLGHHWLCLGQEE